MKKLLIALLLMVLVGCSNRPSEPEYGETKYASKEMDSCEYILIYDSYRLARGITHKGNCKFCIERSKRK